MKRIKSKINKRSAVILDFGRYKLRQLAREYTRYYMKFGPECASIWSIDAVAENDKKLFKEYIRQEMRKHGIKS
jgi:hypothetical protein